MAKEVPVIMLKKVGGKLSPLSSIDAELIDGYADGEMFRTEFASRRSNTQNSLYWVLLQKAVDATGRWPSSQALHKQLLIECRHCVPVYSLDGSSVRLQACSASFKSMKQDEFNAYFKQAVALLAEHTGIDPAEFGVGEK